jgi:hypothetical protein
MESSSTLDRKVYYREMGMKTSQVSGQDENIWFNPLKTKGILRKFQKVITHPKVEGFKK